MLCSRSDFRLIGGGNTGSIDSKDSQEALVGAGEGMIAPLAKYIGCRGVEATGEAGGGNLEGAAGFVEVFHWDGCSTEEVMRTNQKALKGCVQMLANQILSVIKVRLSKAKQIDVKRGDSMNNLM